jgi:putative membrane protein
MGVLYTPFARKIPLHAAIKGMLFGLLVWLGSYFALLPLLGLWESAYTEPTRRNLLMIAAHVVWGASTGATAEVLIRTSQRNSQQAV